MRSRTRQANWRYALNDYSAYLKLLQQTSGPNLANALYGRALCLAKLGKRQLALKDLDECIRVGPEDEQVTDPNASLVPVAIIARFALLHACPELRKARNAAMAAQAQAAADEAKGNPLRRVPMRIRAVMRVRYGMSLLPTLRWPSSVASLAARHLCYWTIRTTRRSTRTISTLLQ